MSPNVVKSRPLPAALIRISQSKEKCLANIPLRGEVTNSFHQGSIFGALPLPFKGHVRTRRTDKQNAQEGVRWAILSFQHCPGDDSGASLKDIRDVPTWFLGQNVRGTNWTFPRDKWDTSMGRSQPKWGGVPPKLFVFIGFLSQERQTMSEGRETEFQAKIVLEPGLRRCLGKPIKEQEFDQHKRHWHVDDPSWWR